MKYVLILFLFSITVYSQSTAFSVKGNGLVWENIYITTEADVAAILEKHPRLKITSHKGNIYSGTVLNNKNSCPGSSPQLVDAEMNFSFELEKSAGMYRVTITKMKILAAGKDKKSKPAESYFIQDGVINGKAQTTADLSCLDAMFNRMFTATNLLKNKP